MSFYVRVLLKNDADRKRLFEAVKNTYVPSWVGAWDGRTDFEEGFEYGTYPYQAIMDTEHKLYKGVNNDGMYPMTVEEFINKYIHPIEGEIVL